MWAGSNGPHFLSLHTIGNTALYQKNVLPDSDTGSKHQTVLRLESPRGTYQNASLAARFHPSLWASPGRPVGESFEKTDL